MAQAREGASATERLQGYTDGYLSLSLYAVGFGVLLILISPLVRKLMHEET